MVFDVKLILLGVHKPLAGDSNTLKTVDVKSEEVKIKESSLRKRSTVFGGELPQELT